MDSSGSATFSGSLGLGSITCKFVGAFRLINRRTARRSRFGFVSRVRERAKPERARGVRIEISLPHLTFTPCRRSYRRNQVS